MEPGGAARAGQERIAVVTDSLAWLPEAVARGHGITVVPLHITIGDEHFTEGVDLTNREFFKRLRESRVLPKTSQPAAGEFLDAYRALAEGADAIVSVHASGKLSGTVRSAGTAAGMLRQERPDYRIEVVDTETAATCQGITAVRAAEAAASGASFEDVLDLARALPAKTRLLFVLETLDYLQKGGRIGRAQALLGSLLQIKPILSLVDGEVAPKDRARTRARAMERCLALMAEDAAGRPFGHVGILHADAPESAAELKAGVRARFDVPESVFLEVEIGPVIGTYTGPGAFGLSWYCD
jgi:DegV family protein with EDD domain